MANRWRELVAPIYLFLCLILGGSAQGIWGNMLLQLMGIAIIAWAAFARSDEPLPSPARQLLILFALAIAVVLVQLIPLPPSIWEGLGIRRGLAADYALLGLQAPNLPISLAPYKSAAALLTLIPSLAMICAIVRLKAHRASFLAAALVAGTFGGVALGAMQVATAGEGSPWYLYSETNLGYAVGFFANANHMADLLVITLPFLAALLAVGRRASFQRYSALLAVVIGTGVVILVGILINRSLAAYGLAVPVLLASALIVLPATSRLRPWLGGVAAILLIVTLVILARSAVGSTNLGEEASSSVESREVMLATTTRAMKDYMPLGSGLSSFRQVYDQYEDLGQVTPTYVVHAHNDYAELALETGVPGMIVLLLFLIWWAGAVWRVWWSPEEGPFARAASIGSAVVLAHSFVDFPLRTAAISACFGMFMALLADRRAPPPTEASDLRPTRHFVLK